MPVNITRLEDIDQTQIDAREEVIKAIIQEYSDQLDLSQGTVYQKTLTYPNAILDALNQEEISRLQQSQSLKAIEENPDLADDDLVDAVLSNFRIERRAATSVTGQLIIVVSAQASVVITADTVFQTSDSRTFSPDANYVGVVSPSLVVNDTDVLIQQRADGNYWFPITVVETAPGGTGVEQGAGMTSDNLSLATFVEAYAGEDYAAALPAETNTQLLSRLAEGIVAKSAASRTSIKAILSEEFPTQAADVSIIGQGDRELTRASHNIFGISHGGKSDVYVRPAGSHLIKKVTVAARPVAATDTSTLYEALLNPAAFPAGFYRVESVQVVNPGVTFNSDTVVQELEFTETVDRAILTVDEDFSPYIGASFEAAYSRYQGAASLRITDSLTQSQYITEFESNLQNSTLFTVSGTQVNVSDTLDSLNDGDTTRYYDVYVSYAPGIDDIQTYINQRSIRPPTADYLVRGAIPCFVSVALTVNYVVEAGVPSAARLQQAIADAINSVPFTAPYLGATTITSAVNSVLGDNGEPVTPIDMQARLRAPDGTTYALSGTSTLEIPDVPGLGVSRRTTAYYALASDITLTLNPVTDSGA